MKTKRLVSNIESLDVNFLPFLIYSALLVCGVIAGTFSAKLLNDGSKVFDDLGILMQSWFCEDLTLFSAFLSNFLSSLLFPLIVLFLSLSAVGFIFLPIVSFARGFFISFTIVLILRVCESGGFVFALICSGINILYTVPVLLFLSARSFGSSFALFSILRRSPARTDVFSKNFWKKAIVDFAVIVAGSFFESLICVNIVGLF